MTAAATGSGRRTGLLSDAYLSRHGAALIDRVRRRRPALVDLYLRRLDGGVLATQAELEESFDPCTRDLEEHVLPWLVERGDWPRFVRYLLVACNLRDLVEELDSPVLLRALVRERLPFAVNLARRLPDPLRRARARAVIVGALRDAGRTDEPGYAELLAALQTDLATGRGGGRTAAEVRCATLVQVVAETGLAVRREWGDWLAGLHRDPDLADRLRLAIAGVLLRHDPEDDEAWHQLGMVRDGDDLVPFLVDHAPLLVASPPQRTLRRVAGLDRGRGSLFWAVVPALLVRYEGPVEELWNRARDLRPPVRWTPELVTAGAPLWRVLPWPELDALAATTDDAGTRATLWTATLAAGRGEALTAACRAVDELEAGNVDAEADLGPEAAWGPTLTLLEGWPGRAREERRERLDRLGGRLARRRFDRPADDLRRFLDLVAVLRPKELRRWIEDVLWGPTSDAADLLNLVRESREERVLEELLARPERCAATVADDEAQGFELRLRVIVEAAARLCRGRGGLAPFETARERVLPEEEDELRTAVAAALAAAGQGEAALEVCDGIRSRRVRRRTRLDLFPQRAAAQGALAPADLYAAVAATEAVEDELDALEALFDVPIDPRDVARRHLDGIRDPRRRLTALADLARHALAFEEAVYPASQRDPLAALIPLREALGVADSDRWLVRVTPELVDLGAALGPDRARVELNEAVERVVARTAVPWEERQEVLVDLLRRGPGLLLGEDPGRRDYARASRWFRDLLRLPSEFPAGYVERDELRRHWHRLLPRIVTAAEAAPPVVAGHLCRPWRDRLFGAEVSGIGAAVARHRGRWDWLTGEQIGVADLCAMDPRERRQAAVRLCRRGDPSPALVEALVILLAGGGDGGRTDALLARFPEPVQRDALRLELLRHAHLGEERRHALLVALEGEDAARHARTLLAAADDVAPLVAALAGGDLDVEDPRCEPLRRRLWRTGEVDGARPALARAATAALRDGGSAPGLDGLRLWLNAHLAPRPGRPRNGEVREAVAVLRRGVRAAASIAGVEEQSPADEDDLEEPPTAADPADLPAPECPGAPRRLWARAWSRRPRLFASGRSEDDEGLGLFLGLCAAFTLLPAVDTALWPGFVRPPSGGPTGDAPTLLLPLVLLLTAVANACVLGSFLAWQAPTADRRKRLFPWLVSLLVSVPAAGFVLAGFHRHWLPRLGALLGSGAASVRRRHQPGVALRLRMMNRPWCFGTLLILNFVSLLALGLRFPSRPSALLPSAGFILLVVTVHVAVTACLLLAVAGRARFGDEGVGRWSDVALALCFLLPVPGLAFAGCVVVLWLYEVNRLVPGRLSSVASRALGSPAVTTTSSPARSADRRELILLRMTQLKVASLFFVAAHVGTQVRTLPDVVGWSLLSVALTGLAWRGLTVVRDLWHRLVAGRRRVRPAHSAASYLAAVALAVMAGSVLGVGVVQGDVEMAVSGVLFAATIGAMVSFASLVVRLWLPSHSQIRDRWVTVRMVFFPVVALAAHAATDPEIGVSPSADALHALLGLGFLVVVPAASFRVTSLLTHPYGPRDALLGRVPPQDRPAAMFLAWTAVLPGGGLAVPLWIVLLRRRAERERRWLRWRWQQEG